jgi:hypothetical protein
MTRHSFVTGLAATTAFLLPYTADAATGDECSSARLRGSYVLSMNGFRSSQTPPVFTLSQYSPETFVGILSFDGEGNVSRSLRVTFAGNAPSSIVDSGSYQISPDCSGSTIFPATSDTWNFYVVDSKSIGIVSMNPGEVAAGTLALRQIADCSTEDLHGSYIFNINDGLGTFQAPPQLAAGFFPVATVGRWTFDGKGGVSRVLSLNFAGGPFPYSDTGTYQVSSNCTASVYFLSDNEPFELIFVSSGTAVARPGGVGRTGVGSLLKQAL